MQAIIFLPCNRQLGLLELRLLDGGSAFRGLRAPPGAERSERVVDDVERAE